MLLNVNSLPNHVFSYHSVRKVYMSKNSPIINFFNEISPIIEWSSEASPQHMGVEQSFAPSRAKRHWGSGAPARAANWGPGARAYAANWGLGAWAHTCRRPGP